MSKTMESQQYPLGMATREAYGRTLADLGAQDTRIVALDADLSKSTFTALFAEKFPDRFFNVGVAEQNLVSTAAGLAASGKIPFISTFAVFSPGRCFDQLRMSVAYSKTNVKVASTHAGLTVGEDGASHQAIEDIALTRALPGFTILVPADEIAAAWAVRQAVATEGPVYIRLGRAKAPIVYGPDASFRLGKANTLREGRDLTIFACGTTLVHALRAAQVLASEGIEARVVDMQCVAPLDDEAILLAARETGAIVTAEEHLVAGGMGSAVAQSVVEQCPVPMEMVGIRNSFGQSGGPDELMGLFGLDQKGICAAAHKVLTRKDAVGRCSCS